jgi:hypothetical protein
MDQTDQTDQTDTLEEFGRFDWADRHGLGGRGREVFEKFKDYHGVPVDRKIWQIGKIDVHDRQRGIRFT